jgi:UDP-glucose 4-epimerase
MLYIENLCEFLCQIMLVQAIARASFVLFPQNGEWTRTSDMVQEIAKASGKKIWCTSVLKPAVWLGSKMPGKIGGMVNKAFGNSCYMHTMCVYEGIEYQMNDLCESIKKTERV